MVKFLCGMTLGVLLAVAFCYGDSQDKIGGVVIGGFCGAGLIIVTVIVFFQSVEKNAQEAQNKWWMTGGKPPWEEDDD